MRYLKLAGMRLHWDPWRASVAGFVFQAARLRDMVFRAASFRAHSSVEAHSYTGRPLNISVGGPVRRAARVASVAEVIVKPAARRAAAVSSRFRRAWGAGRVNGCLHC